MPDWAGLAALVVCLVSTRTAIFQQGHTLEVESKLYFFTSFVVI